MATTFTKIASVTVGSGGTGSITFSSIPQTYTDLVIKASLRTGSGGIGSYQLTFNGSASGYSERLIYGTGTATGSASQSSSTYIWWGFNTNENSSTASTFASNDIYIPNYTSANHKYLSADNVTESNTSAATAYLDAGLWANTAAITSITLDIEQAALFVENSTATLYGIKNS
jgi:hypothetical protein